MQALVLHRAVVVQSALRKAEQIDGESWRCMCILRSALAVRGAAVATLRGGVFVISSGVKFRILTSRVATLFLILRAARESGKACGTIGDKTLKRHDPGNGWRCRRKSWVLYLRGSALQAPLQEFSYHGGGKRHAVDSCCTVWLRTRARSGQGLA
ncbi:MAG TPA: hypothetical protein VEE84_00170 [Burkholderiaceae bacterium]|nr:hypothetical protein [Burkholderiaceae bacterium]